MAYAALLSLMHDMEDAHYPVGYPPLLRQNTTTPLRENVVFLDEFLQANSHRRSQEMDALEARIRHAADAAQDVFESHIVDFTLAESAVQTNETCTIFCVDVQFVIAEIECVKEEAKKIAENRRFADQRHRFSVISRSLRSSSQTSVGDKDMVGADEVFTQTLGKIMGYEMGRKILPIVGMGGIGKTTLAKKIYNSQIVVDHFDIRAWTQLGPEYTLYEVISSLLHDIHVLFPQTTEEPKTTEEQLLESSVPCFSELCEDLYKNLFGRNYLIVLDDLWSIEAWMEIQRYFPDDSNGSRIIVTTRLLNVANLLDSQEPCQMNPLKAEESWELLCKHVFGDKGCPFELEEIGKTILKKCEGLPLAIVVVAGVLSKCNRDREYWELVAEDINEILHSEDDGHCSNILYLSYIHLPVHLKPCFLYMGIFPKVSYISYSKLIKLWVSEGFLKPSKSKTLEKVAEEYLKDLIDRNLILACRVGFFEELKGYRMHDLLRDLCLREACKENFYVQIAQGKAISATESGRRLIVHQMNNIRCEDASPFPTLALAHSEIRTVICFRKQQMITSKCRLLRIFDSSESLSVEEDILPLDILQLVNSRYLAFKFATSNVTFPSSICRLRSLQTLIVGSATVSLPCEIWEMSQLRHLKFSFVCLPDPPDAQTSRGQDSCMLLENLQTLTTALNMRATPEIVRRIPNVKKLKLFCKADLQCDNLAHSHNFESPKLEWFSYCLNNLVHLHNLESLTLTCLVDDMIYPGELDFPPSLKKLTLRRCKFRWENMGIIGSLPNLEVLNLETEAFDGPEWKPNEEEFPNLKFLLISLTNLECWHAESQHFPKLEILALHWCWNLKDIPSGIGDIPTMKLISLRSCSPSAVDSAREILKEQRSYDNPDLSVSVDGDLIQDCALVGLSSRNAPDHDEYQLEQRNEKELEHCGNAPNYYKLSSRARIIYGLLVVFISILLAYHIYHDTDWGNALIRIIYELVSWGYALTRIIYGLVLWGYAFTRIVYGLVSWGYAHMRIIYGLICIAICIVLSCTM